MKIKELELKQKQKNDPIKETQILELKNTLNSDNSIVEEKIAYLTKQRDFFSHQYNSIQGKIEEINKEIIYHLQLTIIHGLLIWEVITISHILQRKT